MEESATSFVETGPHAPVESCTFNGTVENCAVRVPSVFSNTFSNALRDTTFDVARSYPTASPTGFTGFAGAAPGFGAVVTEARFPEDFDPPFAGFPAGNAGTTVAV